MNVLIDTNIVLDVLLNRQPWLRESHQVWQACDEGRIDGYLLASTVTDIFYIARKIIGREAAHQAIEVCLVTFAICPLDRTVLEQALHLAGPDFEDNVQVAAALHLALDAIVTRDTPTAKAAGFLVHPTLPPSAVLGVVPKRLGCRRVPPPVVGSLRTGYSLQRSDRGRGQRHRHSATPDPTTANRH